MSKEMGIYISKQGRKYPYIGTFGKKSSYPVLYFRKSKWSSGKEFETVLEHILETIKEANGN